MGRILNIFRKLFGGKDRITKSRLFELEAYDGRKYMPDAPYMMLHLGHHGCGEPAILLTEYPSLGSVAESRIVRTLDGWPIECNSDARCGTCGRDLEFPDRQAIRKRAG